MIFALILARLLMVSMPCGTTVNILLKTFTQRCQFLASHWSRHLLFISVSKNIIETHALSESGYNITDVLDECLNFQSRNMDRSQNM